MISVYIDNMNYIVYNHPKIRISVIIGKRFKMYVETYSVEMDWKVNKIRKYDRKLKIYQMI